MNGLVCNSSVQVRRVAFSGYSPNIFTFMPMNILKYDDSILQKLNATEL
jgi:hypothetical protein